MGRRWAAAFAVRMDTYPPLRGLQPALVLPQPPRDNAIGAGATISVAQVDPDLDPPPGGCSNHGGGGGVPLLFPAEAGAVGGGLESGVAAAPHTNPMRRAQGPSMQVIQGAQRGAAMLHPPSRRAS